MTSDLELIKSIVDKKDSKALTELVSRHTGIYASIVNQYAGYSSAVNKNDLLDDRLFNIWEYAKDYKPEFGMKFSTYVGERVKYACKTILSSAKIEKVDVNNQIPDTRDFVHAEEARDDVQELKSQTLGPKDKLFRRIMKMRGEGATFEQVAQKTGYSAQWIHKMYNKRLNKLKKKVLN